LSLPEKALRLAGVRRSELGNPAAGPRLASHRGGPELFLGTPHHKSDDCSFRSGKGEQGAMATLRVRREFFWPSAALQCSRKKDSVDPLPDVVSVMEYKA